MSVQLTLDILIATHTPAGILRVADVVLPPIDRVRYIVSWQSHGDAPIPPSLAGRPDVEIHRFNAIGQSHNRNNALAHAGGDILLIADDDLIYTPERLQSVIHAFETHPQMEMALFRYDGPDTKTYPTAECPIGQTLPKGYYASNIEIAIRRSSRAGALRYDPDFGIASPRWSLGEDAILLLTARRLGLNIRFFPITITTHPGHSTGTRPMSATGDLRATGACISLEHPCSWPLRIPLKAWREWRRGRMALLRGITQMTLGALDATFRYTPPWKRPTP